MRGICILVLSMVSATVHAAEDSRRLVDMPEKMQSHLLGNMRDHLETIDGILAGLAEGRFDDVAELAETRLGMSSLGRHGAAHMARFMPPAMQELGSNMHRAASRFARTAQEGDAANAYRALRDVTHACVSCHASYRVR